MLTPACDAPAGLPDPALSASPGLVVRAVCEFGLTALLLLSVVTGVRWLFASDVVGGGGVAFAVLGAGVGALLAVLMLSAPGRCSGGRVNPAITFALWRLGMFRGQDVVPYCVAQLGGSVVGTWPAGLVWGPRGLPAAGRLRGGAARSGVGRCVRGGGRGRGAGRVDAAARRAHGAPGGPKTPPVRRRAPHRARHRGARSAERRIGQSGPAVRPGSAVRGGLAAVDVRGRAGTGGGGRCGDRSGAAHGGGHGVPRGFGRWPWGPFRPRRP